MTFEFLVVCHTTPDSNLLTALTDLLRKTMEENLNEYDDDVLRLMIVFTHCRKGDEHHDDDGNSYCHATHCFRLELRSGELYKSERKIKLQAQPFQVLSILLEHPGDIVSREELRGRLWPAIEGHRR